MPKTWAVKGKMDTLSQTVQLLKLEKRGRGRMVGVIINHG